MSDTIAATAPVTACPICGGTSFGVLGERSDGIAVLRCERCRMGVVAARPPDTAAYYTDAYYSNVEPSASGYSEYQLVATHSLAWVSELIRLVRSDGRVLDVGCADGHLLRMLGPGFELYGIEVNENLRAQCQSAGIRMLGADICEPRLSADYAGTFDVISAIAVLEHVSDIRSALEQIRALLAPEGVLLFELPLLSPTEDNRVWFNSSLEHVYYPTPEGLAFLFEAVFELPLIGREVSIQQYGSTFVGLATRSATRHRELDELLRHLLDTPIALLESRAERCFRFFFDLVHVAESSAESVALLAELDPARVTPELLHRLATLWGLDLTRGAAASGVQSPASALEDTDDATRSLADRDARIRELRAMLARKEHLVDELRRHEAILVRSSEAEAALAASNLELARLREDLDRIVSSRSWQIVVRIWRFRLALRRPVEAVRQRLGEWRARRRADPSQAGGSSRLGGTVWSAARLFYRSLPISGRARVRLRGALLAWLAVPGDAPPEVAVAGLRDLVRTLTWRRATSAAGLLLRGGLASLKQDLWLLVRHSVNQATRTAFRATPGELVFRRAEPWPASHPLVSVIIPCYNYGHFVADAVDSVLAQTFQDFEILVVDGGSGAASVALLRDLRRPKTEIFFRAGRHLVGDNRNFGIARARGKYVCCLDADDRIKPTYLEKALFRLETQDFDLVSCSFQCFGERSEIYQLAPTPVLADMLSSNQVSTCAVFRRDLWRGAGGFQDTGVCGDYIYEDWRLWVRCAALGARFANIVDEPLLMYRIHSADSLSSQNRAVPAMDLQRQAVVGFSRDLITEEALQRSEANRRLRVRREDPFVNLKRRGPSPRAGAPTILVAMPFFLVGGAERLVSEVLAHLAGRGYRIVLVTTEYVYPSFGDATPWFERATAEIYHLPRFLEPDRWQEFIFYLLETRTPSLLWIIGSRVFYDLLPAIKTDFPQLRILDLLFNTVGHTANNRKHAPCFDRILVENEEVAAWLLAEGERPERVLRIPSGVDLDEHRPRTGPAPILAERGIAPGSFIAGFSGRLSEEKAPDSFLDIAHRCRRDADLVFVMTGAGPLAEQVGKRVERMALGERLHFLGLVEDVVRVMASYDVLVLPSRLDGRPIAVLESLALGVPVVASRVGALPELIQEGVTGFLCEPGDVGAFAERIRWLASHPEEHRRMKAAARSFAEGALDARRMLAAYEGVVRELISPAS